MHLPLTLGEYVTASGDKATINEVSTTAIFGTINDTATIWTLFGETGNECNNLVKRYRPVTTERRHVSNVPTNS